MTRKTRKPNVVTKKGRPYYRIRWTESGKRREKYVALPPNEDSPEFDRAYWAVRAGTHEALHKAPQTNWRALVDSYRASARYRNLAAGTRRKYEPILQALVDKNGDKDVRKVSRADVRAIHEKHADMPRKADYYVQLIRLLLNYAMRELEWIDRNPADGIALFGAQTEFRPWSEPAQKAFAAAARAAGDEIALTAFMLGTGTGQRAGDLLAMQWDHIDADGFMGVVQQKTGERLWVYCPADLRAYLATLPKRGRHIIAQNLTQPVSYALLSKRFRAIRDIAGPVCDGLVMHGWRYTAAVRLAEAGCSDAEIQSVTGHRTVAMVQKYRRRAEGRKLSKQAQERRR